MLEGWKFVRSMDKFVAFRKEEYNRVIEAYPRIPSKKIFEKELSAKIKQEKGRDEFTAEVNNAKIEMDVFFKPSGFEGAINNLLIDPLEDNFIIGKKLSKHLSGCEMIDPKTLKCKIIIDKADVDVTVNRKEGFIGIELKNGDMFWAKK